MTDTLEIAKKAEGTITSLMLKGTSSATDRDAGFCSAEEDLELEDDIHSPTDVSEDSVEVKISPISSRCKNKNKRKCLEPRKVNNGEDNMTISSIGPPKKRIRFEKLIIKKEEEEIRVVKEEIKECNNSKEKDSPFRPWSSNSSSGLHQNSYHPVFGYNTPSIQNEPLSLVKPPKLPDKKGVSPPKQSPTFTVESLLSTPQISSSSNSSNKSSTNLPSSSRSSTHQKETRNYKNMTRERRIEANARERTRVHTISAAFDTLRRAIPAYSHNQKLSKLSVLRIACSYILTLSRVAGADYSADQSEPSLANCVDLVSKTIQTEGKLRKKKDE